MDLNWDSHPFHVRGTFTSAQMRTIRELLAYYEDTIYWGGDWTDPIDEMHWQMGYGSYNNPKTESFIARKIRSDGFSTFRRGVIQARPIDVPVDAGVGYESRSPYKTPGEGKLGGLDFFELSVDSMVHQLYVEWSAIMLGEQDAVMRVARAAAGRGADTSPTFVRRARAVLAKVDPAVLQTVLDSMEVSDPDILTELARMV
jgi:hypothetical protein